ncbi:metallophosphoesterase family protein [Sphingomonas sp. TX0543]|uniref:metallophosphoesterase family protein n=1 Tax=unclassified Sphingomonas TaxID=196159 RepID=UPI0020163238|nr:metallophosphoesterase [Sphingomonas sp. 3P27F8]
MTTRLFHVSDIHFGAEDPAALDWFAERVAEEKPDAVIMTGDLTMRARRWEFDAGGRWLRALGVPVTLEVGNHDLPYYWDPLRRLFTPYRRYGAAEKLIERPLEIDGISIIPLKTTARAQLRWNWSKGRVSRNSLSNALALIADAPKGNLIFVAGHHPLIEGPTTGSGRTRGGARALAAFAEAGAHAVLSGHVHDPFDIPYDRDGWRVRLIGAGTLSKRLRQTPPSFNEIRVQGNRFETLVRTLSSRLPTSISAATDAGATR